MKPLPNKAIAFTAYNRVGYLAKVLESWKNVRGKEDWLFYASIDPSPQTEAIVNLFTQFFRDEGLYNVQIAVNKRKLGVLHHPWVALDGLFATGSEYVLRVEDDLLVSDDILEYHSWAMEEAKDQEDIACVLSWATNFDGEPNEAFVKDGFSPLNWGTWKDRWDYYIRDTWDHDYSTNNGKPGQQSGWDWNLNKRVLPERGKKCIHPAQSRAQNIGQHGTHADPDDYLISKSFNANYGEQDYRLGR